MEGFKCCLQFMVTVMCLIVVCHVNILSGEIAFGQENPEFDFDGRPGSQHEFKVDIPGGKENCFFQYVAAKANFHVSFEVLKGGDKLVDFHIRDPSWRMIESQNQNQSGYYTMQVQEPGIYAVCVDNLFNRFGNKLVYIQIITYVMHEWMQFQIDMTEVTELAQNFSETVQTVESYVTTMGQYLSKARFTSVRDWYLVYNNSRYVFYWSLAQCLLTMVAAVIQVYTVRRLFRTTSSKPRV